MKLFFFLRIYDGFSFLVQMMAGVFKDLKYFLLFFIIFILQFGMIFLVLFKAQQIDEYNGVNKMAYFLMAFRISSGDFQLEDYQRQDDELALVSWLIWLIAVISLNIVFMNFIIAVISESYERVMQKLVAESYRVKANLIFEREQLFSEEELKSTKYFPNYIVVRRPLNTEIKEAGEWQGFIKDLKQTIRTTVVKSKSEIIENQHFIQTLNNENIKKRDEVLVQNLKNITNEGLDEIITILEQKLDQEQDNSKEQINGKAQLEKQDTGIDEKVDVIDTKVDELKAQGKRLDAKVDGLNQQVKGLDAKVDGFNQQAKGLDIKVDGLDKKVDGLDTKVLKIQDDMEFIKNSLTQFLQKQNQWSKPKF
ncbi:UNKNOWN [Stylonychia lemnae]|uniref:Ion transport domain-containing protein n=1 Tax=Stylonychia lemnae TaxID=5949 RepID=A0A077ZV91_STYLE|nr:UNKNOWN [Stylonychia lemnae]|eukprot:CDW73225.1 UNKNOWN [Stylonychia lemnae]